MIYFIVNTIGYALIWGAVISQGEKGKTNTPVYVGITQWILIIGGVTLIKYVTLAFKCVL